MECVVNTLVIMAYLGYRTVGRSAEHEPQVLSAGARGALNTRHLSIPCVRCPSNAFLES